MGFTEPKSNSIPVLPTINPTPLKQKNESKNVSLKCAEWNINRGLIKRETEITNLLKNEDLDILFLTETDNQNIKDEDSYKIQGYTTVLQKRKSESDVKSCKSV